MKHMDRKFKEKDALLRENKQTTLEKNEAKRIDRREMLNKYFNKIVTDKF